MALAVTVDEPKLSVSWKTPDTTTLPSASKSIENIRSVFDAPIDVPDTTLPSEPRATTNPSVLPAEVRVALPMLRLPANSPATKTVPPPVRTLRPREKRPPARMGALGVRSPSKHCTNAFVSAPVEETRSGGK